MPHENPWFLITLEETAKIRRHLELLERDGSEKCRVNTGAIAEILTTVEWRLRGPDEDKKNAMNQVIRNGGIRMNHHY